jgi:hypothetical protein
MMELLLLFDVVEFEHVMRSQRDEIHPHAVSCDFSPHDISRIVSCTILARRAGRDKAAMKAQGRCDE